MESIRVLYVEDDPGDQELTRRHLARHAPHLKLTVAETVREALDRLTAGDVDLVLSDYRLPDGTGLDLLETIRAREIEVPVVLVTRSGDAEAAVRLLKAGAADYVVKRPGYPETLPPILEGAYRWFQSAREIRRTPIRLLYAEHDPADVELTLRAFREHGRHFHLDVAPRGREALQRLRTAPYDLLLLDYRLPDLPGIEVLKVLRGERIRVPVVMVTGQGDEETAVEAFKLGAADYIIKQRGYLAKLPSTLENVLAQRRLADEKDALLVLNGLARSITTLRDLGELVRLVARAAADLLKAEIGILWLADGTALRPASVTGLAEAAAEALRLSLPEPIRERAVAHRRIDLPALLAAGALPPGHGLEGVRGALAVSLVTGARLLGVLAVADQQPREFGGLEERLLTILADHAGIAIENARLYEQLKDRLDELQRTQARLVQTEKVATMGQLLAGVAHELNNPLAVVLGRAVLLAQKLPDGPRAADAHKIAQAADRCARIVRNFLALARQRPPERARVPLNQVVQEAVELVAYSLRVDDVDVRLNLSDTLPPVWADPHQLHQVVVNLLSNAHQAMRQTPPPRQMTLTTQHDPARGSVSLRVADTGPGIPPDIQARLFEPFLTTKPPGEGTGLGLALCQGIVDGHGGTIRVESAPGQGAVFVIELPVEAGREMPEAAPLEARPVIRGKTILVVDDEPEVGEILRDFLSEDGHSVDTAPSGVIALEKIRERAYDAILTDARMPGLDGPGLYRELERRHPELLRRLILITGDVLTPETQAFLRQTRVPTVSKPFDLEAVRRVVQEVLAAAGAGDRAV